MEENQMIGKLWRSSPHTRNKTGEKTDYRGQPLISLSGNYTLRGWCSLQLYKCTKATGARRNFCITTESLVLLVFTQYKTTWLR